MSHGAAHGFPVQLSDLTIEYPAHGPSPAHVAVHGLSLRIEPGEVLGLLGGSGSGKSTVADVISGDFLKARAGEVHPVITGGQATVLGYELRGLGRRASAELHFDVGHVGQDAGAVLPADRSVAEIVGEPILVRDPSYNRSALMSRVATIIDAVRLPLTVLDSYPYELSSGQRQRVAIARALVLGPALLVADEPTTGIDVTVRDSIVDLIHELQAQRTFSALIVSHDLSVLERLVDRVAVLDRGRLVALGTLDEVFSDPIHPYVVRLADELAEAGLELSAAE
ncbi:ATP-binding cassette domain-containing protein [Agromyces atrinae]|uniref:ATP-binding cassette domain-containing protein n=1 Tax=Agromyces atrinae TaxID=592376 RepID=UPI001F5617CD|nr:ATP-binding cassette domain-containing protein [Agromyces atrinae]MCI2958755.1 ATP-binding cassette domain-containing protein [Agromyces atrinae]